MTERKSEQGSSPGPIDADSLDEDVHDSASSPMGPSHSPDKDIGKHDGVGQSAAAIVELNVGGQVFATTRQTLLMQENSFFTGILSGKFGAARDANGRLFIDRDGTHFRQVLNFLRDGGKTWTPEMVAADPTHKSLRQLLVEAEFYRLEGMIALIRGAMQLGTDKGDDKASSGAASEETYIYLTVAANCDTKMGIVTSMVVLLKSFGFKQVPCQVDRDRMWSVLLHAESPVSGWQDKVERFERQYAYDSGLRLTRSNVNQQLSWLVPAPSSS